MPSEVLCKKCWCLGKVLGCILSSFRAGHNVAEVRSWPIWPALSAQCSRASNAFSAQCTTVHGQWPCTQCIVHARSSAFKCIWTVHCAFCVVWSISASCAMRASWPAPASHQPPHTRSPNPPRAAHRSPPCPPPGPQRIPTCIQILQYLLYRNGALRFCLGREGAWVEYCKLQGKWG